MKITIEQATISTEGGPFARVRAVTTTGAVLEYSRYHGAIKRDMSVRLAFKEMDVLEGLVDQIILRAEEQIKEPPSA